MKKQNQKKKTESSTSISGCKISCKDLAMRRVSLLSKEGKQGAVISPVLAVKPLSIHTFCMSNDPPETTGSKLPKYNVTVSGESVENTETSACSILQCSLLCIFIMQVVSVQMLTSVEFNR